MKNVNLEYTYQSYVDDVLSGKITVGKNIRLACERYEEFKRNPEYYFDEEDVQKKIRVVSKLKHFTGKHNGKPFILLPYQQWIIASIFGFKYKSTGLRVCKKVFLMLSRKQGKTALASAIGILCAIADGEGNAEVDILANSRQQAKIAFDMTSNFCESVDSRSKLFKRYRDSVLIPSTKSKIQVLSTDTASLDGYNCSCGIIDEFHAARNWDLYNVLVSSQGMREQPLMIVITTAGFLLSPFPCYVMRQTCIDVLNGVKLDDSQFSAIYEIDPEDDWKVEDNWIKAAPSLGQTVSYDYLREQVQSAVNNQALEVGVKTKNFNIFCQSRDIWIRDEYITNSYQKVDMKDFKDEDCFMGVDLSAVSDMTVSSILFPPNPSRSKYPDKYVFKSYIYLPEEAIEESVNTDFYKLWKRQGFVISTPGNVVDYDYILKDQIHIYNETYLLGIGYDSWNATQWAINATNEGLPLFPYSQSIGNFNRPTKTFEMLIKNGRVVIDYNPVIRWSFQNVELKIDFNENCKPIKANNDNNRKIDPVIAMLQALGTYLNNVNYSDGEVLSV